MKRRSDPSKRVHDVHRLRCCDFSEAAGERKISESLSITASVSSIAQAKCTKSSLFELVRLLLTRFKESAWTRKLKAKIRASRKNLKSFNTTWGVTQELIAGENFEGITIDDFMQRGSDCYG